MEYRQEQQLKQQTSAERNSIIHPSPSDPQQGPPSWHLQCEEFFLGVHPSM
jgi:hypothetical protein